MLVPIMYDDRVSPVLRRLPGASSLYGYGWDRRHPFDRTNGTDTSGVTLLATMRAEIDHPALAHAGIYAGAQPSIVRAGLRALPRTNGATFIDLGCGKGRPLLVATEFPFDAVIGIELTPGLAAIARANAALFAARHPDRVPVRIETGDATEYPLPPGALVLFLYNPFGAPQIAKVVSAVERAIAAASRDVYVVYYNPVHGDLFDASPLLSRRWARMVTCAREERGYGFGLDDAVMIWQGGSAPPARLEENAKILLTNAGTRVELGRGP